MILGRRPSESQTPKAFPHPFLNSCSSVPTWSTGLFPNVTTRTALWLSYRFSSPGRPCRAGSLHLLPNLQGPSSAVLAHGTDSSVHFRLQSNSTQKPTVTTQSGLQYVRYQQFFKRSTSHFFLTLTNQKRHPSSFSNSSMRRHAPGKGSLGKPTRGETGKVLSQSKLCYCSQFSPVFLYKQFLIL